MPMTCHHCGHDVPPAPEGAGAFVTVPCHVRAFLGESFGVWRCPSCRVIHCRDVVDLDHYYARYPFAKAKLTAPFKFFYANLRRRLKKHGLTRETWLLDYGCGKGLFVRFLGKRGYARAFGYDPYGNPAGTGDPANLDRAPFDMILLQDVIEHVEEPGALLAEMDGLLAPGGRIVVGTPNADRIDLARPDDFLNELHAPYHRHIYTRDALETLGRSRGWQTVGHFDRPYHDRPWFGLNTRAAKVYQQLSDNTMDAVLEKVHPLRVLRSPRFLFYGLLGYWLSDRADMTVVFQKPGSLGGG
jgi:2-polyprenyl-3-methyl-5-hydroxy-6-metoxy-1,4-benzoquinol methylase